MPRNTTTNRTSKRTDRENRSASNLGGFSVLRSPDTKSVVRDTVSFYREFTKRPDVRGILEDLSKS